MSSARKARAILLALIGLSGGLLAERANAQESATANAGVRWARLASEAHVERAEAARRRGDTAQAVTAYMRALRADPTYGKVYFGLSEIRRVAGDLREAELLLNRAVGLPEARAEALGRRSALYSAKGRDDLALLDLQAAVATEPSAQRLRDLAAAYAARRSWVAALAVYRQVRANLMPNAAPGQTETDETIAALAVLAAECDAAQHDLHDHDWVRRALRQITLRLDRPFSTAAQRGAGRY
jgi:tetratricopeptide (TPR) repeat protein